MTCLLYINDAFAAMGSIRLEVGVALWRMNERVIFPSTRQTMALLWNRLTFIYSETNIDVSTKSTIMIFESWILTSFIYMVAVSSR